MNINIDHIATLRRARGGEEPSPIRAARVAEKAGAAGIVAHLREDRRHITDNDLYGLKKSVKTKLNMEMAATDEMLAIALSVLPDMATIVPEKREELTTEEGLDVAGNRLKIRRVVSALSESGITVSLFIDPVFEQIEAAADAGARMVEIHTGAFANQCLEKEKEKEFQMIEKSVPYALDMGLQVSAGHGLDYENTKAIASLEGIKELNIGYGVVSRAVFYGMKRAVEDMVAIIAKASERK